MNQDIFRSASWWQTRSRNKVLGFIRRNIKHRERIMTNTLIKLFYFWPTLQILTYPSLFCFGSNISLKLKFTYLVENITISDEFVETRRDQDFINKILKTGKKQDKKNGKSQTLSVEFEILLGKTIKKFNIGEIKPDENQNMMDSFKELPCSNSTTNISSNKVNLLLCYSQLRLTF
jgi:hypothetical protein